MAGRKATAADAQIVLQLYDFRREVELRKARNWFAGFHPKNSEDVLKVANAFGAQENAWFRQVLGYWDMAAALALRGAVNQGLFFDTSSEMYFVFAKLRPYVKELREKTGNSELLIRVEKLALSTKEGRERLQRLERRIAQMRQRAAAAASATN